MKRPSRYMPKFVRRRHWWSWLALAVLAFVPVYFLLEHPVGTAIVLAILVTLTVVEHYRHKRRLKYLVETRAGESICDFARSFELDHVDTWVIRAVYEQIQEYLDANRPVPIRATDRLNDDLRIDSEDIEMDLAEEISQRTGRALTNTAANPYYAKVATVKDLVLFFNAQPKAP